MSNVKEKRKTRNKKRGNVISIPTGEKSEFYTIKISQPACPSGRFRVTRIV